MIDGLSFALTVGCVVAAAVLGVRLLGGRFTSAGAAPIVALIEVGLLVQAVLDVVGLVGGHRPGEPATHLAYLVLSVLVVPIAVVQARGDDGAWSAALVIAALLVGAVLVVRMQTTWRSA